ncbi:MAG: alkaline phosphatase family protein [Candidatus Cloacimonetes bacterium]|nr:alkaline phosphatase family protein [Candidatus Cloacimonadota bacterium]
MKNLAVFGIDCLGLDLIDRMPESFEFILSLKNEGKLKQIKSCDPPITIPAWSVMTTGKDPGELGIYGFSKKQSWDYFDYTIPSSKDVRSPRIWDKLNENGLKSSALFVPQTYPVKKINGEMVSSILTPTGAPQAVYPEDFKIDQDFVFDIDNYRCEDKAQILEQAQLMLDQKNRIILRELQKKNDLFFSVIVGADRLNHAFYQYIAPEQNNYIEHQSYKSLFQSYYKKLDNYLKRWFELSESLGYEPIMISDHGVRPLKGVFPLNDWLIFKGYLVLKNKIQGELLEKDIDWAKTKIYAKGGYCGRLFVNKKFRQSQGIVEDISALYKDLQRDFLREEKPFELHWTQDIYKRCAGYAPDFLLYVNHLDYRCSSKVFGDVSFRADNDTGPDGANHDRYGVIATQLTDLPKNIQSFYDFILNHYQLKS